MSKIILDTTGLYQPLADYIAITSEVEWLQKFDPKDNQYNNYWIKGKRLCNWTEEWLRVWNKSDLIIEKKQPPRPKLEAIFAPLDIPNNWDDTYILKNINRLDSYNSKYKIESLLADITNTEENFWLTDDISVEHLANWLSIEVDQDYKPFEELWKYRMSQKFNTHNLVSYYQTENKHQFLLNWLGLNADVKAINLGKYPLKIPDFCLEEFRKFWTEKIYQTEAIILDNLILHQENGNNEIASIAYNILLDKHLWITSEIISKISLYLSKEQTSELEQKLPPNQPLPLSINASYEETLKWVTESYLPFRRWETTINYTPKQQQITEKLADDFINWMIKHYPELKIDHVEKSLLNYNGTYQMQNLARENIIIWVVVDGLGWLDHQELIAILTEDKQLSLERDITPLFSIIPTKTEYAKWSLYSQLLPENSSWKPNAKDGFAFVKLGKRYTDQNKHELHQDLQENKYKIYCWDTDQLDELYHQEKDWKTLYKVERINRLQGIARNIQHFLDNYPHSEKLKIVISSDHGQIMGEVQKLANCPEELQSKGRMAIGKTDDPRFIVLDARRFGLPYDISIVRNSDCITAFNYTKDKEIIGSHGGLFPEEVIVGFSVLSKSLKRNPIIVSCTGKCEVKQPGELTITIDNPNSVPLKNLCLYINELPEFSKGKILNMTIPPHQKMTKIIPINYFPEIPIGITKSRLDLSGQLTFSFANTAHGKSSLSSDSFINIQQIFSSGIQGGLDDFF
jgi:hypothetical protein